MIPTNHSPLTQLELPVSGAAGPLSDEVERFIEIIQRHADWMTAREVEIATGWGERKCRALASASEGKIISGNRGYKHTSRATPEEFQEFYGRMTEQGKAMLARAEHARRVHHAFVG
jgi:hypothetical protein